uniref:hypothetical protein n=1 Tax=Staphylococcus epidermidis TaxID=1282 RepID=UPI001C935B54
NTPQLSPQKFINNPFPPPQLYPTPHLPPFIPHPQIQFLPTIHKQLKLHPYPIQLPQIQNIINSLHTLTHTLLILAKHAQPQVLHPYYLPTQQHQNHIS